MEESAIGRRQDALPRREDTCHRSRFLAALGVGLFGNLMVYISQLLKLSPVDSSKGPRIIMS